MLTKSEVLYRYRLIRKYTVNDCGMEVAGIEKCVREIAGSHNEALDIIEKLEMELKNLKDNMNGRVDYKVYDEMIWGGGP